MSRAFGYLRDLPDARDRVLGPRPLGAVGARPQLTHNVVHLRRTAFQVGNSCVGFSWKALLQWFHSRDHGEDVELAGQHAYQHGLLALPGAAGFKVQPDGGCYPRDVCRAGKNLGVALERDWPASYATLGHRVPPVVAESGLKFADYDYRRVELTQDALLDALVDGVVQVGGPWWESWSAYEPGTGMAIKPPEPGEIMEGGHAFLAIDYDLTGDRPLVLCGNQWAGWGFEQPNAWNPKRPLQSMAWFELEALIPTLAPRHWGISDAWTLRAAQPAGER